MKIQRPAFLVAAALAAFTASCAPHARVGVGVYADVPGPPSLAFETEPYLVPLPGTYAYAVPDYDVDLYYADGYYWRPWQGRWYRSAYYDRGWVTFSGVPGFYTSLPRDWRDEYRSHRWRGRSWDYARVPRHEVERNWSNWKRERRWDDDQRRYTGDRRWHDDGRRDADRRDRDGREVDRRQGDYDRRETDRRESSGPGYGSREPERREVDRRAYENRDVDRRGYDARPPVERREIEGPPSGRGMEPRPVVQERRAIGAPPSRHEMEPRPAVQERGTIEHQVERRGIDSPPGRREMEPRPVVHEPRSTEQQVDHEGRGQGKGHDVKPHGRGPVGKDANRDGIDDNAQRP